MTSRRRGRPPGAVQTRLFAAPPTARTPSTTDLFALLEPEGAFLTPPVLKRAFPSGIPRLETERRALVRERLASFLDGEGDATARTTAWRRFLLGHLLDWSTEFLEDQRVPAQYEVPVPEHGVRLRPNAVLVSPDDPQLARVLVFVHPAGTPFDRRPRQQQGRAAWAASPLEQAERVCRDTGVPLALLSDGERMTLLWAPKDAASGSGAFVTSLFAEEPVLLDGFVALLEARRFFATGPDDTPEALFRQSADAQAEVTTTLGRQVRSAVELLVDAIGRADREADGRLLATVPPSEVYNAAVTVLMRMVFLLSAEERGLFPLGDPVYAGSYAVASLRDQLRDQARGGQETLERRTAAWHRLLALFRAVHGGVNHSEFRLPAYGGSLFDPNRFPFLEGRPWGTDWRAVEAAPLPVDDRTVLGILDALKVLRIGAEARVLSYRTLDVEQIGHVYEGLLDHGCLRASETVLGFAGKSDEEVSLAEAEGQLAKGPAAFAQWIEEITNMKAAARARAEAAADANRAQRLLASCGGDVALAQRVRPFLPYLRDDVRHEPYVILHGTLYVTRVSARRDAGAQYTTKELADEVVKYALEPLVYKPGPAEGAPPENWQLIPAADILKLKVCDPAVGSGAILVAAGRYLAERLMEAWAVEEADGLPRSGLPAGTAHVDDDEVLARRAIADHCLYGVDRDPLAAEMAKLSLWLTTLSKERPFTFLDHAIQCGDSLLGITSLDELDVLWRHGRFTTAPDNNVYAGDVQQTVNKAKDDALAAAQLLMDKTVLTVRDAEDKAEMHRWLLSATAPLRLLGDLVVGSALASCAKDTSISYHYELQEAIAEGQRLGERRRANRADRRDNMLEGIGTWLAEGFADPNAESYRGRARTLLASEADEWLDTERPAKAAMRRPLHWPLAFPEVFLDPNRLAGFDAMVGNPPFLGGKRISGAMGGAFREYLVEHLADGRKGNADLIAFFFLRAASIAMNLGFLATNSLSQGDTREVALDWLLGSSGWTIHHAVKSRPWPGEASLEISQVWMSRRSWMGKAFLEGKLVTRINSFLEASTDVVGNAERLVANEGQSFIGSALNAIGFVITDDEARSLLEISDRNIRVVKPYLNGEDLNDHSEQKARRWAIDFLDWPREQAESFPECFQILQERVYPTCFEKQKGYPGRLERWWQFWNTRAGLRRAKDKLSRVLALAETSKTLMPAFVSPNQVLSHMLVVLTYEDDFHFGVLSSAFHWWWAVTRASTMRTDIRYTPTDCFETFPQPPFTKAVEAAGKALDDYRRPLMIRNDEGLTKTYNRVHNPADTSPGIPELRELHVKLDYAVRDAYSWDDLPLDHGLHQTSQGVRFTIGPDARRGVLDRLLELNHKRYAEEVGAGLHDKKKQAGKPRRKPPQMGGTMPFDLEDPE